MVDGSTVFISYAHEDQILLDELVAHLRPLEEEGLISSWSDRQILPGSGWEAEIDDKLKQADLVLLLVSADFINSQYAYGKEMVTALARATAGLTTVVPVILRPVAWEKTPLGMLNVLPSGGKSITSGAWGSKDEAFTHVAKGLRRLLKASQKHSPARADPAPPSETSTLPHGVFTVFLVATILFLGGWLMLSRLDASHSDQFLYEVLSRSLNLAASSDRFGEVDRLSNDAGKFYEGLHLGQNKKQRIQALALHYQGVILDNRDQLSKAENALEASVKKRRQLMERDPDNFSLKSDLAESLVALGAVQQHGGQFAKARQSLEEGQRFIVDVAKNADTNLDFGRRKFLTEFRLGRVSDLQAESTEGPKRETLLANSKKFFSESHDTCSNYRNLAKTPSKEREWDSLCAYAWSRLGRLEQDTQKARLLFEQALKTRQALLQENKSNTEYQLNLAESQADLARLYSETQNPEAALELATKAAQAVKKGHDDEPNSVRNLIWYCELVLLKGRIYGQLGRAEEAKKEFRQVVDRLEVLVNGSLSQDAGHNHSKDLLIVYSSAALELGHRSNLLKSALDILKGQNSAPRELVDQARKANLWQRLPATDVGPYQS